MRFLLALFLFATPAYSATYSFNVTGQMTDVAFGDFNNPAIVLPGDDPTLLYSGFLAPMVGATTGTATYSDATRQFSGCTGLMANFCLSSGWGLQSAGSWTGYGGYYDIVLTINSIVFRSDAGFNFDYGGTLYQGIGQKANIALSSVSVSPVPLPAGVLLLLSGLGLLWWRRSILHP